MKEPNPGVNKLMSAVYFYLQALCQKLVRAISKTTPKEVTLSVLIRVKNISNKLDLLAN